jgi:2-dehydropantoate 2-reductase
MSANKEHIVFVGAGAVGGYVGGHLARAGHSVTLVDPWWQHVERIKREGMHLGGTQGEYHVRITALHITEAQSLIRRPADIAFICVKLYDTEWASALIKPYLKHCGFVVTMQNCLVEESVARIVGWGRTVGCIASTISVEAVAPGHIIRTQRPGGDAYTVFRVGELHGGVTARVQQVVDLLRAVDSAKVTTNLWGERWSKLVANTMTTGVSGFTGLNLNDIVIDDRARRLQIRLAAEAIKVGRALGFTLVPIKGMAPERWIAADAGAGPVLQEVEAQMLDGTKTRPEAGRSSTAQDLAKGRRTEVEFMNGYVAARGVEVGIPAPAHAKVAELVRKVESGELAASPANLALIDLVF